MERDEARELCRELTATIAMHDAVPVLEVISELARSWTLHAENSRELAEAIAAATHPNAWNGLFDADRRAEHRRLIAETTRRLLNWCSSGCSLVDRMRAVKACSPQALESRLGKLINDLDDVPVAAFVRKVRDDLTHFAICDVNAVSSRTDLLLVPRGSPKRSVRQEAQRYWENARIECGGVPDAVYLGRLRLEHDAVLARFAGDTRREVENHFAPLLVDYRALEAELERVAAVAYPDEDERSS